MYPQARTSSSVCVVTSSVAILPNVLILPAANSSARNPACLRSLVVWAGSWGKHHTAMSEAMRSEPPTSYPASCEGVPKAIFWKKVRTGSWPWVLCARTLRGLNPLYPPSPRLGNPPRTSLEFQHCSVEVVTTGPPEPRYRHASQALRGGTL